jgi:hypothetical protein
MTLKEKFREILSYPFCESKSQFKKLKDENENQLEKIADDYAIEFAEWIIINCNHKKMEYLDLKQLLEIFKKEKGL